jgi:4-amino-4-deoxy-L-arabinose transferase-like glycosyltransferase
MSLRNKINGALSQYFAVERQQKPFFMRIAVLIIIGAAILLVLPSLLRPLFVPDEARYAEVSREALVHHDWLFPTLNGVPHLTKPPLYYDLVALTFAVFGVSAFSARIVSIVAFILCLIVSLCWVKREGGETSILIVVLLFYAMLQLAFEGQFADLNMLLALFLTAGQILLFQAISNPENKTVWGLAWLSFGLGFLTKGPPAIAIPLGTLLIYRWLSRKPLHLPFAHWLWAAAIFSICALPWYIWILLKEGTVLADFLLKDIFERTSVDASPKGTYYYLFYPVLFIAGTSGWGIFLLFRFYHKVRAASAVPGKMKWLKQSLLLVRSLPAAEQWLLCWIAITLLAFSAMRATMASYILPAYPATVLLLAFYFTRHKLDKRFVHSFFTYLYFSLALTFLSIWLFSVISYCFVHMQGPPPEYARRAKLETTIVAKYIKEMPQKNWELVQCKDYCPLFSFVAQRESLLYNVKVHREWDVPARFSISRQELQRRIENGDPLLIVLERKNVNAVFPLPHKNLKLIYQGNEWALFSTIQ